MIRFVPLIIGSLNLIACDYAPQPLPSWEEAAVQERGVHGIEFGDSLRHTRTQWGHLQYGGGWWHASYTSGLAMQFEEGILNGLRILYANAPDESALDGVAHSFGIKYPYPGRTEVGIGIGSQRTAVVSAYGHPKSILDRASTRVSADSTIVVPRQLYLYCLGKRHLEFSIEADTVSAMYLGHYNARESSLNCAD